MQITTNEAMTRLGIGRTTLQNWLKSGKIKYRKLINNRVMIDEDSLETFIMNRTTKAEAKA